MKRGRHFYVSGRVQGVFYRATACDVARRLGLTGWVRNLPDGRVEALACGEAAALRAFEAWLWEGPAHARVEAVVASDVPEEDFKGFRVR
ncbi:acylphosphatase [Sulfurifustis variabilis]|uniref:acylphosphatase n=1 Tax=Sulfurifustis variabilis TaxID=1675686 RepID=A0A1B4V669_9GAMM|nr:acylphosphatase [Sulfurifustis variabilis]